MTDHNSLGVASGPRGIDQSSTVAWLLLLYTPLHLVIWDILGRQRRGEGESEAERERGKQRRGEGGREGAEREGGREGEREAERGEGRGREGKRERVKDGKKQWRAYTVHTFQLLPVSKKLECLVNSHGLFTQNSLQSS